MPPHGFLLPYPVHFGLAALLNLLPNRFAVVRTASHIIVTRTHIVMLIHTHRSPFVITTAI